MVELVLSAGLAFIMLTLGLSITPSDFTRAIRRPKALIAGIVAQIILLPLIAFGLLNVTGLNGESPRRHDSQLLPGRHHFERDDSTITR